MTYRWSWDMWITTELRRSKFRDNTAEFYGTILGAFKRDEITENEMILTLHRVEERLQSPPFQRVAER